MNDEAARQSRPAPTSSSGPRVAPEEAYVILAARVTAIERRLGQLDPATREEDSLIERRAEWCRQVDAAVRRRHRAGEVRFLPPAGARRAA